MVVVEVGEKNVGAERLAGGLQRSTQVLAEGAQPRPQIDDQGWLPGHLHQHAGGVAPVAKVSVG